MYMALDIWSCIFCIIAAIIIYAMRSLDKKGSILLILMLATNSVLNLTDSFAYYYRGMSTEVAYYTVRIANFTVFCCSYFITLLAYHYILRVVERRGGKAIKSLNYIAFITAATGIIFLILSRIFGFYYAFDENNRYYRLEGSYPFMILFAQIILILILMQVLYNIQCFDVLNKIAFLCFAFLPIISTLMQIVIYGIPLVNPTMTACIMFLFFIYEKVYTNELVERENRVKEEKIRVLNEQVELDEMRIKFYSRQIQPHFIYNSLASIRALCEEGSEAASGIDSFAGYLRSSSEFISDKDNVAVERELKLVDNYLEIMKLRFGDKISVKKQIDDIDFSLPPFTIQVLAENSVNHGIRHKPGGRGTITIRTFCDEKDHIVQVSDDGVGYVPGELKEDGEEHLGVSNTRKRLGLMCGGTMEIESEIGVGTCTTIRIKKQ